MKTNELLDLVVKYRRDLHQIPEIGFDLYQTNEYLVNELRAMGYKPVTYAKTGVVAVKPGEEAEAIAFRSDMDALPVFEKTGREFQSKIYGAMHACGHDGHMAMLLGFAKYVSNLPRLKKTLVFLFQPAEEGPGGAKVMIEENVLETYHIKAIFGLHLYPGLKEGIIGLPQGAALAACGEFDITVSGKGAHGAKPEQGKDAIIASASLIQMLQTIVSRSANPLEPAVVTIGTISGGTARNIIAEQVHLSGTIRSFQEEEYQKIKRRIQEIASGIELAYQLKLECAVRDLYPALINDNHLYRLIKESLQEKATEIPKMMFSEDFAYFLQKVPGFFAMLGTKDEESGFIHPLHSGCFDFSEKVLLKGIEYYIEIEKIMQNH